MPLSFSTDDDQAFKSWLARHPNGFYLNEGAVGNIKRGSGGTILHKVGCHHLGDGAGINSTTYAKVADDSLDALHTWARDNGLTVQPCSSCKPG